MHPISRSISRAAQASDDKLIDRVAWVAAAGVMLALLIVASSYFLIAVAGGLAITFLVRSWLDNEVRQDFRVPIDSALLAVYDSLIETGFGYGEVALGGVTERSVAARGAHVAVEQHPGGISRVRIRVGAFDLPNNRRRAALLLERVVQRVQHDEITADLGA